MFSFWLPLFAFFFSYFTALVHVTPSAWMSSHPVWLVNPSCFKMEFSYLLWETFLSPLKLLWSSSSLNLPLYLSPYIYYCTHHTIFLLFFDFVSLLDFELFVIQWIFKRMNDFCYFILGHFQSSTCLASVSRVLWILIELNLIITYLIPVLFSFYSDNILISVYLWACSSLWIARATPGQLPILGVLLNYLLCSPQAWYVCTWILWAMVPPYKSF